MQKSYRIISADGHNIEPPHIWDKYLPKRFAEQRRAWCRIPRAGTLGNHPGASRSRSPRRQRRTWGRRNEENDWDGSI